MSFSVARKRGNVFSMIVLLFADIDTQVSGVIVDDLQVSRFKIACCLFSKCYNFFAG